MAGSGATWEVSVGETIREVEGRLREIRGGVREMRESKQKIGF